MRFIMYTLFVFMIVFVILVSNKHLYVRYTINNNPASINAEVSKEIKEKVSDKAVEMVSKDNGKLYTNDTQFVALSFDGSWSLNAWEKTLKFADELRANDIPIDFTYFVSGVYLLPQHQKSFYDLSWMPAGKSNIAYGDSVAVTDRRIGFMNTAMNKGHEIGSHLNGHFDGTHWSKQQWEEEFGYFNNIVDNTILGKKIDRGVILNIKSDSIVGIRTPLLSKNDALYQTLQDLGYKYDASKIGHIGDKVVKDKYGIWQFPLVHLKLGEKNTLSMDYNHFLAQTNCVNKLKRGTPDWEKAKKNVVDEYYRYFNAEYNEGRNVVNIGHHFSTWNDSVYWEAMKEFALGICGKPNVVCTNYSTIVEYLESE